MDENTGGMVIGIVKQGIIGMFIYLHTKNVKEYRFHKTNKNQRRYKISNR